MIIKIEPDNDNKIIDTVALAYILQYRTKQEVQVVLPDRDIVLNGDKNLTRTLIEDYARGDASLVAEILVSRLYASVANSVNL